MELLDHDARASRLRSCTPRSRASRSGRPAGAAATRPRRPARRRHVRRHRLQDRRERAAGGWMGERPESPQLPLYVRAVGQEQRQCGRVRRVRTGAHRLHGFRARQGCSRGSAVRPARVPFQEYADWGAAAAVGAPARRLAHEFGAGDARLAPDPTKACRRCHLPGLCRSARIVDGDDERSTMQPAELLRADAEARRTALDVTRSFIVQAPAGSGKTELLTQRFLALLAIVEQPESVLAITFTRKAAAEMRNRILEALRHCDDTGARTVARRHARTGARACWRATRAAAGACCENPGRLRLLTIDALNQSLARRLPVLSGIGAGLGIEEDGAQAVRAGGRATAAAPAAAASARSRRPSRRCSAHVDNDVRKFVRAERRDAGAARSLVAGAACGRRGRRQEAGDVRENSRRARRDRRGVTWQRCRQAFPPACWRNAAATRAAPADVLRSLAANIGRLRLRVRRARDRAGRRPALARPRGVPADERGRAAQVLHAIDRRAAAGKDAAGSPN